MTMINWFQNIGVLELKYDQPIGSSSLMYMNTKVHDNVSCTDLG
jgi:hypothetical protein